MAVYHTLPIFGILACLVPTLLAVAFVTLSERKVLSTVQRRVVPNSVGAYGSLQTFSVWGARKDDA
jgi:NADH:ubiquinone oxidoreductase subunit H